jgi:hypothetical protein
VSKSIDELIDGLPSQGLTVRALNLLDHITPGQWENTIGFDNMIQAVTGEQDADMEGRIRARALELYNDTGQGYQRAVSIYQTVDTVDAALGAAALAHKIGEKINFLSFLRSVTPRQDKAQAMDLAMKLISESVSFCYANGFPGDGIGDFVSALESYEKENLIRMSAIIVFNGLIPLGPQFAGKLIEEVQNLDASDIENSRFFQAAKNLLPGGGSAGEALAFMKNGIGSMESYVGGFADKYGITLDGVLGEMKGFIDFTEDKLDYLAAFLDMSTNYMTHTGVQSVGRILISRAVGEI